ncbi:MAG TPA: TIGR03790 family protein [Phycisphaerae bacterium]|nr:TIGR03790 family protein [Phycisphaerae bacterium]
MSGVRIRRRAGRSLAGMLILAAAGPAFALSPDEVAVVANAADKDSVALAGHYAQARGIPQRNLLLVRTTTAPDVSRDRYDSQILHPIAKALQDRRLTAKIKCVCIVRGVPLRIGRTDTDAPAAQAHRAALEDARRRLAVDYKLIATVAVVFPKLETEDLSPVARLFAAPLPRAIAPTSDLEAFQKSVQRALGQAEARCKAVGDPAKQQIAARQLMGLHLDIHGLRGLIDFVQRTRPAGAPEVTALRRRLADAEKRLGTLNRAPAADRLAALRETGGLSALISDASQGAKAAAQNESDAALDSELALLGFGKYETAGPRPNPLYWRNVAKFPPQKTPRTLMTARIDGPSRGDAFRIIKASIAAEQKALRGVFYVDAGGRLPEYDAHLRRLYRMVKTRTKIPCTIDERGSVFPPSSCPQAACYVGWSSPGRYVAAFSWVPGAVGWHVAGSEAADLRNPDSRSWCVQMIRSGVAATLGAVEDPQLGAFPLPEEFFALLLTGKYTLAECYWRTVPHASWRMMLIGDPLYNPFKEKPELPVSALPKSLAPGSPI